MYSTAAIGIHIHLPNAWEAMAADYEFKTSMEYMEESSLRKKNYTIHLILY